MVKQWTGNEKCLNVNSVDTDMCNNMCKIGRTFGDYAGLSAVVLCTMKEPHRHSGALWRNLWPHEYPQLCRDGMRRILHDSLQLSSHRPLLHCYTSICWYYSPWCCCRPHGWMSDWGTSAELPEAVVRGEKGEREWCQNSSLGCACLTCQLVRQSSIHPDVVWSSCQVVRDPGHKAHVRP